MRNIHIHVLAASILMVVTACNAPTTQRPTYTKAELAAEQQKQAAASKAVKKKFNAEKDYSAAQIAQMRARLEPIATRVENASRGTCLVLTDGNGDCRFKVMLDEDKKGLNAHADGKNVVLYPAMIDFAEDDDHLAFVLAHEFAHNMLRHPEELGENVLTGTILGTIIDIAANTQGINTSGTFGKLGSMQGRLTYSPEFEHEADYVGLYILARGNLNYAEAPDFWRTMSLANPDSIYLTSTHPTNPARAIEMEKTIQEINTKRARKEPLLPNFLPQT